MSTHRQACMMAYCLKNGHKTLICCQQALYVCMQEHMAHPLCCAFDPASKTLAMAGQGASKAGAVCLTLWHLLSGSTPTLFMQHGRPARQGFFSRQKLPLQPWQLSLDAESRTCLIAVPGGQLHVFRWQARLSERSFAARCTALNWDYAMCCIHSHQHLTGACVED